MSDTRPMHAQYPTILILDFGSQYSHLILRRLRDFGVYSELLPCTTRLADIDFTPKGIILSGSPYSVYDNDSPRVDPAVFAETQTIPVMGICYGLHEIVSYFGGKVQPCERKEYGAAEVAVLEGGGNLFDGAQSMPVWMSHGDSALVLPDVFKCIATTSSAPLAAVRHISREIYGVQFHPEVTHGEGARVLKAFTKICGVSDGGWGMSTFVSAEIARIREICGERGRVIGAVSGGVDSSVAAKLMHTAIGDRFRAIMVDNGVLRLNEAAQVEKMLIKDLGVNLTIVDASELFLSRLKGITDPEQKRKIIGNTFINVFEAEAAKMEAEAEKEDAHLPLDSPERKGKYEWLLQGTLYPDVIESISFKGPSATIKTHHNVGGLLKDMKLKLIEPLRELFKDEVRQLGRVLGLPDTLVGRHPFPGPGLAIRILGEVTAEQVTIVQAADEIFISEIRQAGLYDQIAQAYAALLPVKVVGVKGDQRTYEQVICLRAVTSEDFMTADWFDFPPAVLRKISGRITNEVRGVNRVFMDVSSKPPATIELE